LYTCFSLTPPAPTSTCTLSLHDALPIFVQNGVATGVALGSGENLRAPIVVSNADANVTFNRLMDNRQLPPAFAEAVNRITYDSADRKSTRLNSSHLGISYAVFCLKKKTQ